EWAGDRTEDRADEDQRVGHATAHGTEQLADGIEQILGQTAAFEDGPHEREKRDRQQQIVGDDAEQLVGQIAEKVGTDQPELDADKAEEEARGGKRERRRIADEHEKDHAHEHQWGHVVANEAHCSGFCYLNSSTIPCSSAATRLMISEMPCRAISAKPTGISSLTGQRMSPPAFEDCSC